MNTNEMPSMIDVLLDLGTKYIQDEANRLWVNGMPLEEADKFAMQRMDELLSTLNLN